MAARNVKKTTFSRRWCEDDTYSWVREVQRDKFSAFCCLCKCKFSLSNMGKAALKSHMNGKKHRDIIKNKNSSLSLSLHAKLSELTNTSMINTTVTSATSTCSLNIIPGAEITTNLNETVVLMDSTSKVCSKSCGAHCHAVLSDTNSTPKLKKMQDFIARDTTTRAEIMWCLNAVMQHQSLRDVESSTALMKMVFSDSTTAKGMQLSKAKVAYTITYGISRYFKDQLTKAIEKSDTLVIAFDESLNKVCEQQQMDIVVRFWNKEKCEVCTRYFTSAFLGHTTANDLLDAFKSSVPTKMTQKVIQISMDGPNVNFKFLKNLREYLAEDSGNHKLLDLGSCGLHTLHCAFKAGIKVTEWHIIEFLRAVYNLFKNVPARRADYTNASGSKEFPLKFCAIRWLENVRVVDRACAILLNLRKYTDKVVKEKKVPKCASYEIVSNALTDKLLSARLAFFRTLASDVEPFLTDFQSDDPLAPFLYERIVALLKTVMVRFVRPDILNEMQLSKIDLDNKDHVLGAKYINLGYATEAALRQTKQVSDFEVLQFREQCRKCIKIFVNKIMDRSPIKFPLVRAISCMDPAIAIRNGVADKRLQLALEIYVEHGLISGTGADKIDREYKKLRDNSAFKVQVENFNQSKIRLDHFWVNLIKNCGPSDYSNLLHFVELVMTLSHGNAAVERGFSINKECLVENQKEKSLIAQRIIYDGVNATKGLENLEITKDLIHFARNAHAWYKEALATQKRENEEEEERRKERKRAASVRKELEAKKRKLLDNVVKETAIIDDELKALKYP